MAAVAMPVVYGYSYLYTFYRIMDILLGYRVVIGLLMIEQILYICSQPNSIPFFMEQVWDCAFGGISVTKRFEFGYL